MPGIIPDYRSIRQVLQGRSFSIDEYQREFKWERSNVGELMTDPLNAFPTDYREGHTQLGAVYEGSMSYTAFIAEVDLHEVAPEGSLGNLGGGRHA